MLLSTGRRAANSTGKERDHVAALRLGVSGPSRGQVQPSTRPRSPAVKSHLPVNHVRYVAARAQELHHLLARPGQLRPTGFGFRVLLKPSNLDTIEYEVHLPQSACSRVAPICNLTRRPSRMLVDYRF